VITKDGDRHEKGEGKRSCFMWLTQHTRDKGKVKDCGRFGAVKLSSERKGERNEQGEGEESEEVRGLRYIKII